MSLALSSVDGFTAAVGAARSVEFHSYTLADGRVLAALVAAARAGAAVTVRLEGRPLDGPAGGLRRANLAAISALTAAGADAALSVGEAPLQHMKAALVDGTAWLDDRNWTGDGSDTVLRDSDPGDVGALRDAFAGRTGHQAQLATSKAGALAAEAGVVRGASTPVAIQTESFGSGPVASALLERARRGLPTRLLVAERETRAAGAGGVAERRLLDRFVGLGVEVRTAVGPGADEKLGLTGDTAWTGSANATYAHGAAGEQADWGRVIVDPDLRAVLGAHFAANWSAARPWRRTLPGG